MNGKDLTVRSENKMVSADTWKLMMEQGTELIKSGFLPSSIKTPAQAIAASTINAAASIKRDSTLGSLTPGKQADLIILDVPNYKHLGYRFGTNLVSTVVKRGKVVH